MPTGVYERTEEYRRKMSKINQGMGNPNYGKHPSKITREKMGKSHLGNQNAKGYKHSMETRKKMSEAHSGEKNYWYGKHRVHSEETKKKIGEASKGRPSGMKGKHHSDETKRKMSEVHKGIPHPWSRGQSLTDKHKKKLSIAGKGKIIPVEQKNKISISLRKYFSEHGHWNTGKQLSEEIRAKISETNRGKIRSEETRTKISKAAIGRIPWNKGKKLPPFSEEWKRKIGDASRGRKLTKEQIKNRLRRRIPTHLENKFQAIIDKHNLPYKFVGDGSFIIENCNPDFVNTNNKKIAIEVYAKYYKERDGRNIERWKEKRTKVFSKYGWKIFYFDETQVIEKFILSVLRIY